MKIKRSKLCIGVLIIIMSFLMNIVCVSAANKTISFSRTQLACSSRVNPNKDLSPFMCDLYDLGYCYADVEYVAKDALKAGDVVSFTLTAREYIDNHDPSEGEWTDSSSFDIWVYAGDTRIGYMYAIDERGYQNKDFSYVVPAGGSRDLRIEYSITQGRENHKCYVGVKNFTINGDTVTAN